MIMNAGSWYKPQRKSYLHHLNSAAPVYSPWADFYLKQE